jgi:segregation and condensation protein A
MLDLSGVSIVQLVMAARELLLHEDLRPELSTVVAAPAVTIRQKIQLIARLLRQQSKATFRLILGSTRSRLEIVVTFLAMLELIKRHLILAHQENLFGEIALEPAESWDENEEFDLEFGE